MAGSQHDHCECYSRPGTSNSKERKLTSPFERHNIAHLSPSSLNLWAAEPALWCCEKLLGHKQPASAIMARGSAVEAGIHHALLGGAADFAEMMAFKDYDGRMALSPDPRREEQRKLLPAFIKFGAVAIEAELQLAPIGYQERIEVRLGAVPVPLIGYIDWRFDGGEIVDLKTTERFPSRLTIAHRRQGALYKAAHANHRMRFIYVKPSAGKDGRATQWVEVTADDMRQGLIELECIASALGRFLALSGDPRELTGLTTPDYDSFYWSSAAMRALGKTVFGF